VRCGRSIKSLEGRRGKRHNRARDEKRESVGKKKRKGPPNGKGQGWEGRFPPYQREGKEKRRLPIRIQKKRGREKLALNGRKKKVAPDLGGRSVYVLRRKKGRSYKGGWKLYAIALEGGGGEGGGANSIIQKKGREEGIK